MHCSSTKSAATVLRIFFGLGLMCAGIAHYRDPTFAEMVGAGLGPLTQLGMAWGFLLPGFMIVGGLLFAFSLLHPVGAWLSAIALGSIPAGLMLKSAIGDLSLVETMPAAMNAYVWIIVFLILLKMRRCCCSVNAPVVPPPVPVKSAATKPSPATVSVKPKRAGPPKKKVVVKKEAGL